MLSTRSVALVAASAGALVALAGCGSSSGGSSAGLSGASPTTSLQDVQSAYSSTVGQKSAKLSLVEHLNVDGHALTINGAGLESFADKKFTLTTTVAGQQIEIRELGQVLYEKLPAAASAHLPGGKPWLSVNLNTLVKHLTGASLSELEAGQQEDPANTLSYLKQASASGLHKVGPATVRGVATTEYTATIDLNKVAAAQPGAVAKAIKAEEKSLGTSSYPISVWLDAKHLVRQLTYHSTVSPTSSPTAGSSAGSKATVSATLQFYDFGTPVTVTAPAASQTTDITKLLQGLTKSPLGSTSSGSGASTA
ncbi:MAG TPA: hypothetical protein VHW92_10800 [Mycobacteriales bacterium]|jgi:hypothetical protein|nr:hypothetical protein [Mycobacteriales bacterium]